MREWTGHTVINGELRHASVSSVKSFDVRTKGGCPRRWAYTKVFGVKADAEMNVEAKEKGAALDKELKHYLHTGDKTLSSLALKGLHILEAPGADLKLDVAISTVEHYALDGTRLASLPEGERYPTGTTHHVRSALTADGVPFVGELDMAHERGHFRDDDGDYHDDPPGTVEVADIKFKTNATDRQGNSLYFLPTDMIRDIQMAGYGEWVRRVRPNTTHIRLSMLYFPEKKGLPTKVTRLHVLDDFPKTWARVESVVREMKDVARATDIEQVPGAPDISTCDAYSGCPHREYCSAYRRNSLDKTYGKLAEDYAQEKTVGLISNNPSMMMNAPVAQPAQQPDMRQQLAEEEARQRQAVAQQQQQMPQQLNGAELQQVCIRLQGYGFGFPTLGGNAAQAYAFIGGQSIAPGSMFPGQPAAAGARRSLHGIQLTEVAHLYQLESELAKEAAVNAPAPVMMQQAPLAPQMQTFQVQQTWQAPAPVVTKTMDAPGLSFSVLPPDAPPSMPQLAMQHTQAPPAQTVPQQYAVSTPPYNGVPDFASPPAEATATPAPKAKGRPKKVQDAAPGPTAAGSASSAPSQAVPPTSQPVSATPVAPAATSASREFSGAAQLAALEEMARKASTPPPSVLVNCRTDAYVTKSLASYVDYINTAVSKKYNVGKDGRPGILDVRAAVEGSVLGYGGWKGAVREIVKVDLPPADLYHLDTHRDDLSEAVVDGLRQAGWVIIRGVFS